MPGGGDEVYREEIVRIASVDEKASPRNDKLIKQKNDLSLSRL